MSNIVVSKNGTYEYPKYMPDGSVKMMTGTVRSKKEKKNGKS